MQTSLPANVTVLSEAGKDRRARIAKLEAELARLRAEELAEKIAAAPFKVGDMVQWESSPSSPLLQGRVCKVIPTSFDHFDLNVQRLLKGGIFSQHRVRVYSWMNPELVKEP